MIATFVRHVFQSIFGPYSHFISLYESLLCVIPSSIIEVIEFDPEETEPYVLYRKSRHIPYLYESNWTDGFPETSDLNDQAMYLIRGWNQVEGKQESYYLNAYHLCQALGLKNINHMWALSDMGIIVQLSCYLKQNKHKMNDIFDIQVPVFHHDNEKNGVRWKDITSDVSPYLKSLQLTENVTARGVIDLYRYIKNEHEDVFARKIKIIDYDLESKDIDENTFCFTH
jgi:hypothetical protein